MEIKKGQPNFVRTRPCKPNIQVRIPLFILDLRHVVLTYGAIYLFINRTKIIFRCGFVDTTRIDVVASPKIRLTHVLQRRRSFKSIPKM